MTFRYGVLGAGRQGTAAAYDIARFGDAELITVGDADLGAAQESAARVNTLAGRSVAEARQVNARAPEDLGQYLKGLAACVSAVPYYLNAGVARAAIAAGCSLCDLGGNTDVVLEELAMDEAARAAAVSVIPDCGVGPGLISNLAVYAIEKFNEAHEVLIYDGGLPQHPRPPFNYACFFNIEGLTNEYAGDALYLRDGAPTRVKCFDESEYELVEIPALGQLEAFTTSGALSTMVTTYAGRLRTLKNKTLRYVGHYALFKGMAELGLLDLEPVRVAGSSVVPRDVLHALLIPRFAPLPEDRDLMVIHLRAHGLVDGRTRRLTLDMLDTYDEATGFTAMERTTGFHASIVAQMMARGETARGAIPLERAVSAARMVEEVGRRGMEVKTQMLDE
ncbi:MAG TPA: saccharopine dehydrogenase C-terminal domain-containing protein [Pyrinomonadaceae bacterium]|jgi:lysine 6-dehydrogenase|nr:saccharopine dehydrogenase C-terminal domain-containing protein [Pyrinomonadaceae bacterium]